MKRLLFFLLLVSFGKKLSAQVNPQTGSATFSLPMFNWNDDQGRLNSAISINYNSGNGLKVDEVASNVGLGWDLVAGGVISRIVSGEPDDQKKRDAVGSAEDITNDIYKYPAGYLYNNLSASDGCHSWLTKYPLFEDENHVYKQHNSVAADVELDRFAFQINGKSGLFVLGKNNGAKGIILGDSKMKIWYKTNLEMDGIRTTIDTFFVQDENGLKYTFANHSLTRVLKNNYCDPDATYPYTTQPGFKSRGVYFESFFDDDHMIDPYIINQWYLTQVEDVLTHRKIIFSYDTWYINANSGTTISINSEKNFSLISRQRSKTQTPAISSITYPDGHLVKFNYGNSRFDLNGAFALASVDIMYNHRYVSKYELSTSYFILNRCGTPASEKEKSYSRLCLRSIKKDGVDLKGDDPPYYFDYHLGSGAPDELVPPPFFHIKDIWGFYNGYNSKSLYGDIIPVTTPLNNLSHEDLMGLCFLRQAATFLEINPKSGYAKFGLLKQITYPAGGSIKYEYEQNYGVLGTQYRSVGGVHVSKISVSDGVKLIDCTDNTVIKNYTYTSATNPSQSSLWGLEMPTNTIGCTTNHYEPEQIRYHWGIRHGCFPIGCCKYKYKNPGILSREGAIDLTGEQKTMETLSLVLDIVSAIGIIMDVVTIIGSQTPAAIIAIIIDAILNIVNLLITCFHDYSQNFYSTVYYNMDLNGINPLPVQFSRVEVTESSGGNGKTVMEFTNPNDIDGYPIWEPTNPSFSMKQRFAYWAYGLLRKSTVFNAGGNPVTQTENVYSYALAKKTYSEEYIDGVPTTFATDYPSCKCLVKKSKSLRRTSWQNPEDDPSTFTNDMTSSEYLKADIYKIYTGRVELTKTTDRVFKVGSSVPPVESITEYQYDAHNYQPKVISTYQSNGDINEKTITYSGDSWEYGTNQGDILGKMASNNILNIPIESRTTVKKASTNRVYDLNETVTQFVNIHNGDVKPCISYENRRSAPELFDPSAPTYCGGGNCMGNSQYKATQYLAYDAIGHVINAKDEAKRSVSSIYDYNDKFVIASIINAEQLAPKEGSVYTSFETDKFGGWTLVGIPEYTSNNSVTGNNSFVLSSNNSLKAYLNDDRKYTVSFWAADDNVVVENQNPVVTVTLIKAGPIINGFKYYEYNLSGIGTYVKITGNTVIDELRAYPTTARMRTVTYDPLIGKTSECDENNRITYYEYDDHGRLRFIKDDYKNIIKMYEYNYAKNPQGQICGSPVVYTNPEISAVFTKDDCGKDYIGSEVTYTIPAHTYTSVISQADVDQQVQNDLDANGQAYANNPDHGTCIRAYHNHEMSKDFTKQGCDIGLKGTTITYTVPEGRYTSIIDQATADHLANVEIAANGQAYANAPGNATCVIDYDPDWIGTGNFRCYSGSDPSMYQHQEAEVIDQNPNSSSVGVIKWVDNGLSASCGATLPAIIDLTYTNAGSNAASLLLKNVSTGQEYSFIIEPNISTQAIAGQVTAGDYEVQVILPWGSLVSHIYVYNTMQTGSFYLNPVSITTAANPLIRITN